MSLSYNSNVTENQWLLKITFIDSSINFYFSDENSTHKFGNALASLRTPKGSSLKFPKLGITTSDLSPDQIEALGKTRIESVLVTLAAIDGPADKAGIQPLDVITEINGIKIKNDSHFNSLIDDISSGTKISITCLQRERVTEDGKEQFVWKPTIIEMTVVN